jgi:hypothetical protein
MVFLKLVHTESQVNHKSTILGQDGSACTQGSNPSWACHDAIGSNNYPPFRHSTQNQIIIPKLDFLFFAKIRLEITNTYMMWCQWQLVRKRMIVSKWLKMAPRV